mgnify:CR=1 FL=1
MNQQIKIVPTGMLIIDKDVVIKIFNKEEDYKRELKIHKYCAKQNIAPKLLKAGGVRRNGVRMWHITMEKYDITLKNYVKEYGKLRNEEFQKLEKLVEKMHNLGVYHEDLHEDNIMFNLDTDHKIKKIVIIDYGLASVYRKILVSSNNLPKEKSNKILNYDTYVKFINNVFLRNRIPMRNNWHQLRYIKNKYVIHNFKPSTPRKTQTTPRK